MNKTNAIYILVDNENLSYEQWIDLLQNEEDLDTEWTASFYESFQNKLEEFEEEFEEKMEEFEDCQNEIEELHCELARLKDEICDLDHEELEDLQCEIQDIVYEINEKQQELKEFTNVSKYGNAVDYFKGTVKFDVL